MMQYALRNGYRWEEAGSQDRLLEKMYHCMPGRLLLKGLTLPAFSKLGGWFLNTHLSGYIVGPFIRRSHLDMSPYEPKSYTSYNDFFTRRIKSGLRPVCPESDALISPCDGRVSVFPIDGDSRFLIKGTPYTVASLTKNRALSEKYKGGWCVLIRLCVEDYHHYCYVDDGIKGKNHFIPGVLHTVNPTAVECVPVYKENAREYSILRSRHFGDILQMEVGALMVGKITNLHQKARVCRGQEKGYFEFGGSTVVLLLEKDRVNMDDDLIKNTKDGFETIVKMGERIGTAEKIS